MKVYIIKPKDLQGPSPCNIYVHGGGAIFFTSEQYQHVGCHFALSLNIVYVLPEFRNAPEAKVPKGATDVYTSVKHICQNAGEYGIDENKICLTGRSGGSYLSLSAAHMLAKANEVHMVKALFL